MGRLRGVENNFRLSHLHLSDNQQALRHHQLRLQQWHRLRRLVQPPAPLASAEAQSIQSHADGPANISPQSHSEMTSLSQRPDGMDSPEGRIAVDLVHTEPESQHDVEADDKEEDMWLMQKSLMKRVVRLFPGQRARRWRRPEHFDTQAEEDYRKQSVLEPWKRALRRVKRDEHYFAVIRQSFGMDTVSWHKI
ncbi:unnamed protein product [Protopolystoma xenopodis]|uniref:Uncharacterized protein n=1 Tax=Protopolystoma xenopodis TaxID=117903 RepID=A0A3S5CLI5_9PLAT|nr:unnamed protein product [Protopolystoma xenopodis]